ncbi:unnamed protein product [Pleuronectes platessa]|uniref:Uncharacterized protein n=1 Tax=Pleuronectes platessa TaxID=8262 RepID=A0A9N7UU62_PLEPL|nr:unnamed protein product [Pleuronectes platessa]
MRKKSRKTEEEEEEEEEEEGEGEENRSPQRQREKSGDFQRKVEHHELRGETGSEETGTRRTHLRLVFDFNLNTGCCIVCYQQGAPLLHTQLSVESRLRTAGRSD